MNVSELARKLNIEKDKLLKILPKYGFDVGRKAIKIDDKVAQQVIDQWSEIKQDLKKKKKKKEKKRKKKKQEMRQQINKQIEIPENITVRKFADKLGMAVTEVISELMDNGILANKNQDIDFETASIVAEELGYEVKQESKQTGETKEVEHGEVLKQSLKNSENIQRRAPVIIVMGHVDHGKTKLLDTIRKKNIIDTEAGGITQHIGAYEAKWRDPENNEEENLTFIDTPGHQAFTAMRSRGAQVADVAILVVAADDGVKPQTKEAIQIMKAANIPFVVAINKIDKNNIDIQRTKKQLSEEDVIPEDWGGDTPMVEISAKQNQNVDELLDMLLLMSDVNEDSMRADPDAAAVGTVIESHKDKQMGSVATILIQNGTLEVGEPLIINGENYGNVRNMWNHRGETIEQAGPAVPAQMIGFEVTPEVGDILDVAEADEADPVDVRAKEMQQTGAQQKETLSAQSGDKNMLNLYLKADVQGSLEAIIGSLEEIEHKEVDIDIVGKGLGNITEDDVNKAEASDATIIGFQVEPTQSAKKLMKAKGVEYKNYDVIYDIIEWTESQLEDLLEDKKITKKIGNLKILAIFSTESNAQTIGGRVESGQIVPGAKAKIKRNGEIVGRGEIVNCKKGQQDVDKVKSGEECGLRFEGRDKVQEDDVLEFYVTETKEKELNL
jgi:translation initiation factor IF-2